MPNPYAIFTSYACRDVTESKERLFRRFVDTVREIVDGKVVWDPEMVCFVDRNGIKLGDVWDQTLAEAIGSSQVLVCLVSPHYLNSEWCGRELRLFLDRIEAQPAGERRVPRVFPLIWELTPGRRLPAAISQFQFQEGELPQAYRENGLRQVVYHERFRAAFQKVVEVVSDRIRDAILHQPPLAAHTGVQGGWTKADWEALINCLENERQPCELEILSCVRTNAAFGKNNSLRDLSTQLRGNLRVAVHSKSVARTELAGNLRRLAELEGIPVLLAAWEEPQDVETVLVEAAQVQTPIGVVLLDSSTTDVGSPGSIEIPGLRAEIQSLETKGQLVRCTPQTLAPALERLAIHLRNERLGPLESARVISVDIEQRAAADGVPTAQRPDVLGPNGRSGP
jgi:hypothetical protein